MGHLSYVGLIGEEVKQSIKASVSVIDSVICHSFGVFIKLNM